MKIWMLLFPIFFVHTTLAFSDAWLIVPGKAVGVITAKSTRRDLIQVYGEENVRSSHKCWVMDGMYHPCILLFENTPRQIRILLSKPRYVEIQGDERWHIVDGIHIGSTVEGLEELNGTKFEFVNFSPCGPEGYISSWRHGKLSNRAEVPYILFFLSNFQENLDGPSNPDSSILPRKSRIASIRVMFEQ